MLGLAHLPPPWNMITILLLAAIPVLLIGSFLRYPYRPDLLGRMPASTELPQSFLLIGLALIVAATGIRGTPLGTLGWLVMLGIAFGFLGDLFMADVFGQEDHVLYGMAAFAVGHVFYMFGFREIALAFGLHNRGSYLAGIAIMWIVAVVIWWLMIRSPAGDRFMQRVALGYALFLASMAGYALGIAWQQPAFWPMAVGGILFVFSDGLIAARMFGGREFRYQGDVIWLTYIIAQALIVMAVPAAWGLL